MTAPIQKDLPMARDVVLEEHDEQGRRLHQPVWKQSSGVGYAPWQAVSSGSVLRVVLRSLPKKHFHPGQRFRLTSVNRPLRIPHAGQIGFAILSPRRWPGRRGMWA